MQDKLEKERADAKNFVEEYVYEMRDKIYTSLEKYVKEDDRAKFSKLLDDTENWLYEDGEDENKNVYVTKLQDLKVSDNLMLVPGKQCLTIMRSSFNNSRPPTCNFLPIKNSGSMV